MHFVLAAVLALTIPVGGVFGEATATVESAGDGQINVEVTLDGPSGVVVVVHLIDPGDNQETVTLGEGADGRYTGEAVVENANLVVVFEAVSSDGVSWLSDPLTLLDLGASPEVLGYPTDDAVIPEATDEPMVSAENVRLLWLAVAAAASALALLAWWAAGPKPDTESQDEHDEEE